MVLFSKVLVLLTLKWHNKILLLNFVHFKMRIVVFSVLSCLVLFRSSHLLFLSCFIYILERTVGSAWYLINSFYHSSYHDSVSRWHRPESLEVSSSWLWSCTYIYFLYITRFFCSGAVYPFQPNQPTLSGILFSLMTYCPRPSAESFHCLVTSVPYHSVLAAFCTRERREEGIQKTLRSLVTNFGLFCPRSSHFPG